MKEFSEIIFIYENIGFGGVETLILRIGRWFSGRGIKCIWLAKKCLSIDFEKGVIAAGIVIDYIESYSKKELKIYSKKSSNADTLIINFTIYNSFIAYYLSFLFKNKSYVLNYSVHPLTYIFPIKNIKNTFYNIIFYPYKKAIIKNMFFMDEDCYNSFDKNKKFLKKKIIVPLPVKIPKKKSEKDILKKFSSKIKKILVMSRLEFPFKGYVVGVLKDVLELDIKKFFEICIIGDGDGASTIKEIVDRNKNEKIIYREKINYEELELFFDSVFVFIGMGTSVLDAAKFCVPPILADAYTYEFKTSGFLSDQEEQSVMNGKFKGIEFLKKIVNMTSEEYLEISRRSYEYVKNKHNEDVVNMQFLKYNKKTSLIAKIYSLIIFFIKRKI